MNAHMPGQVKSAVSKRHSYRWLRRSTFSVALLVMAIGLGACGPNNKAEVTELAENFLADLRVGAWNAATSRMHSNMQAACGLAIGLEKKVIAENIRPQAWTFTDISAFKHTGFIQATITTTDGAERHSGLDFERDDGEFKILSWRTDGQNLCDES